MILLGVNDRFNQKLSEELGIGFHELEYRYFADSEIYARIKEDTAELKGTDVLLNVRDSSPPFRPMNIYLTAFFVAEKLAREYGSRVFGLLPYMPFQRQDKRFKRGEVTSLLTARKALKQYMECIVSVSLHDFRQEGWRSEKDDFNGAPDEEREELCRFKFGMPLEEFEQVREDVLSHVFSIDPAHAIGRYLKGKGYGQMPVTALSPDLTASDFVRTIADEIGATLYSIPKMRDRSTGDIRRDTDCWPSRDLIDGRVVMPIDDMFATGSTVKDITDYSRVHGAREVICVGTHAVLAEKRGSPCLKRMHDAGVDDVMATDTIVSLPVSRIEIASEVASKLREKVFPKYGVSLD
jgi:ribose-phosphate pyrophosphokinase